MSLSFVYKLKLSEIRVFICNVDFLNVFCNSVPKLMSNKNITCIGYKTTTAIYIDIVTNLSRNILMSNCQSITRQNITREKKIKNEVLFITSIYAFLFLSL